MVAMFHGVIEKIVLTLVAIPFLNPGLNPHQDDWPEPVAISGLLVAAALYVNMRTGSQDFAKPTGPGLSIFSLWGLVVSVGLGIFGGWVFWVVRGT